MNMLKEDAIELTKSIVSGLNGEETEHIILCPPAIWIEQVLEITANSSIQVGAQNCSDKPSGAFTGEISAKMLASAGVTSVLLGHSERRAMFHETNEWVADKLKAVIAEGLTAVLCIGETLEERNAGKLESVLNDQLSSALNDIAHADFSKIIVAYEPVWAIGTGLTASPEQAQEAHAFIRNKVASIASAEVAANLSILYGGSCNAANAATLFAQKDIDGGLIGGASLKSQDFLTIARSF